MVTPEGRRPPSSAAVAFSPDCAPNVPGTRAYGPATGFASTISARMADVESISPAGHDLPRRRPPPQHTGLQQYAMPKGWRDHGTCHGLLVGTVDCSAFRWDQRPSESAVQAPEGSPEFSSRAAGAALPTADAPVPGSRRAISCQPRSFSRHLDQVPLIFYNRLTRWREGSLEQSIRPQGRRTLGDKHAQADR